MAMGGTNKEASSPNQPLTGNEPPEELMRRVRELRDRGEEPPPEIRAKLRELFQSGALQRPAGGAGPGAGGTGSGAARTRPAGQPSTRTIYVLPAIPPSGSREQPKPQAARIKTGIGDGANTEVLDGLKEGDIVVTGIKQPQGAAPAPAGSSPFGGGRRGF